MTHDSLRRGMQTGIFEITHCIAQGPFATEKRLPDILAAGITHVINVGESPNRIRPVAGLHNVQWKPIADLERIPDETAIDCLRAIHDSASEPGSKVYIHCVAGQNRSPTVVWLYLVACGVQPAAAKEMISQRTMDAVPAHPNLIDDLLVQLVAAYGRQRFLPLARPEIIVPA